MQPTADSSSSADYHAPGEIHQPLTVRAPTPRPPSSSPIQPESPGMFFSAAAAANPTASLCRRLAIAVDLSDESAYAVKWAVDHYLRPGDAVVLLHVRPTSVLYGADWGSLSISDDQPPEESQLRKMEDDFDAFTAAKAEDLAKPLKDAGVPYKIHIVKDHDMKERLCLEVERLRLSAVIMGSKGFGAVRKASKAGRLGSVSDYCVHHCICPVVVVRCPDDSIDASAAAGDGVDRDKVAMVGERELHTVPEEEPEYHDAAGEH